MESRRKAYYLMAIHEQLPRIHKVELQQVGWTKLRHMEDMEGIYVIPSLVYPLLESQVSK